MNKIINQLKTYIETHPFNSGDSNSETVFVNFPLKIIMQSSTSAASSAAHMNAKPSSTVYSMAHILC